MGREKLKPGMKFNRLEVIKYEKKGRHGQYICKCDCGNISAARAYELISGRIKSCGCYHKEEVRSRLTKSGNTTAENQLYSNYKCAALKRGYVFNLDKEEFLRLIYSNCYYCGSGPERYKINPRTGSVSGYKKFPDSFKYNGIDRVNNNIGYENENCVSCCAICNISKSGLSKNEWLLWLDRIARHQGYYEK